MAAFASASSSQVPREKYDVFISFRGTDVRSGFLSHLLKELRQKSIDFYMDDRLKRGEEISSALVKAIEGSMIALVIFSKNYASSKWCLEELVKIMERKEAKQQIVIPIFYHIDPSHVRHQKRTYAHAFTHHEKKFEDNLDKLQIWRSVLKKYANLSGYHSSNFRDESKLVDAIVKNVFRKLKENNPIVPKSQLVGFYQNFISVELLMGIHLQDVQILGIWGMGGIGKTTLARAIFDKFLSEFESSCFLENVKESARINGLSNLHQKLLSELIDQEDLRKNKNVAMSRLQQKKVLIVLDDVDDPKQIKYLAGQQLYLGPGSRVIATSRDKHVLRSGGVHDIHEVKELNFKESLELFSLHAFNQSHPYMGYEQLSNMTVAFAKGIPLALEVLGAHFHSRNKAYWESELRKLQKYLCPQIQNILKVSFDGLDPMDKRIFLDIAFFFVGEPKDNIIWVLEACGFQAISGVENLIDKALIKSNCWGKIEMHDLIQEMAEHMVREECITHPKRRSRLKEADEICDILESNKGADEIEGIRLDVTQIKSLQLRADVFINIKNLRILKFFDSTSSNNRISMEFPFGIDSFPNKLRYFYWDHYPLESLPLGFCFENLVELHMKDSNVKKLWDGVQNLVNLKAINLSRSKKLMELPDFSMAYKLENVDLLGCTSLSSIHPSILSLHTIVKMDVSCCSKLESIENETHLESLCDIRADHCYNLKKFCLSSKKLRRIYLFGTEVEILHLTIGRFTELRKLIIDGQRLRSLPINELCYLTNLEVFIVRDFKRVIHTMELYSLFYAWPNLRHLCMDGWSYLSKIPDNIKGLQRLESLSLNNSSVETLPACLSLHSSLEDISLRSCKRLKSILGLPPMLKVLDATECPLLENVSSNSLLRNRCNFYFHNCVKLDESSLHFIEELTHSSMTSTCEEGLWPRNAAACYPGNRVPKWMKYKQMTEASNTVKFTCNLERSHDILFCCVVAGHLISEGLFSVCCDFSYDDNNFEDEGYNFDYHELHSNHVFLWHMQRDSYGGGTGNHAKVTCKFFMTYWNDEDKAISRVPVEACGVHVIYNTESESDSDSEVDPKLSRNIMKDADIGAEERFPSTKKLKNSSQPTYAPEIGVGCCQIREIS